jgi:flagellar protein FliS
VIAIIGELQCSLDHGAGGEIAANLARLYHYMRERLTNANSEQSDAPLAEVSRLLESLGDAWRTINTASNGAAGPWLNSPGHIPLAEAAPSAMGGWSV